MKNCEDHDQSFLVGRLINPRYLMFEGLRGEVIEQEKRCLDAFIREH